ncbi:MAG: UDP-N-acetylmuramate dehydrogenase [Bacteroidales bacterium]|jgi:UDP-N-acetylmuramate dehydrogenase|nr:UDP-N-acetylmuramate dehydrogenase [Bacteroidales bacterium]
MYSEQFSLQTYNTFGLDVTTHAFFEYSDMQKCIDFFRAQRYKKPIFILGGGSNVLFTKDFPGTIIHPNNKGIRIVDETQETVFVSVAAGEVWDDFVAWVVEHNFYGIENLSLIPGSVGASAVQNIGAYGVEAKDFIHEVVFYDADTDEMRSFSNEECAFGYRSSFFKRRHDALLCISHLVFALSKKEKYFLEYGNIKDVLPDSTSLSLIQVRNAILFIRETKLPNPEFIGNAGSFFKNPVVTKDKADKIREKFPHMVSFPVSETEVKIAAGWLLDELGCKTFRVGDAAVHEKQALVLINLGHACGNDFVRLAERIIQHVNSKVGIELEPEVIFL